MDRPRNNLGTVPIFVRRKWDCPLPKGGSHFSAGPMFVATLLLLACPALAGQLDPSGGVVCGTVVNASGGKKVPCQSTVVLRVQAEGQFVPFRETAADAQGNFRFDRLPVGDAYRYLIGANRHGIHYPGPRIHLTAGQRYATVELTVHDAVTQPDPLLIRRYEITLCPEAGALRVTEAMLVVNPSSTCYVGEAGADGAEPVTLQLAIPSDFERTTFGEEFYGRRFGVKDGKVVTSIPWPPGQRELKFTYVLRNAQRQLLWERPLDLPCSDVRVRVRTEKADEVTCDLPPEEGETSGDVVFRSSGAPLPAGHVIRVTLGHLPVPWMAYARWLAIAVLAGLVASACIVVVRRRGRAGLPPAAGNSSAEPSDRARRDAPQPGRSARRKRKHAA
jgi:hypothetical protein